MEWSVPMSSCCSLTSASFSVHVLFRSLRCLCSFLGGDEIFGFHAFLLRSSRFPCGLNSGRMYGCGDCLVNQSSAYATLDGLPYGFINRFEGLLLGFLLRHYAVPQWAACAAIGNCTGAQFHYRNARIVKTWTDRSSCLS